MNGIGKGRRDRSRRDTPTKPLDSYADQLNNAVDDGVPPPRSTKRDRKCVSRRSSFDKSAIGSNVVAGEKSEQKKSVRALDVEIWAPSFLQTPIGPSSRSKDNWLRVIGSGCPTHFSKQISRPTTAPPTVRRLQLTPRPSLQKFRPIIYPPPKPLKKLKKPIIIEKPPKVEPIQTPRKADSPRSRCVPIGETHRREHIKRRKVAAKVKAEKIFRDLLPDDSGRLRYPCYLEPSPVPGVELSSLVSGFRDV